MSVRVALAGWFSLDGGHTTIGDELARDAVCGGLAEAGVPFRLLSPGERPDDREVKVWISGPVDLSYPPQAALLGDGAGWIITSSSLIADRAGPGLADVSTARDGVGVRTMADLAFLAPPVPGRGFAALLLRGHQPEYRQDVDVHRSLGDTIEQAVTDAGLFPVPLTTRVRSDGSPFRFGSGLEAAIAASEVVVTSRLHGILHSLRCGRFPVVVDEIVGGGKVTAFCRAFDVPVMVPASDCTVERLTDAIAEVSELPSEEAAQLWERAYESARRNREALLAVVRERRGAP